MPSHLDLVRAAYSIATHAGPLAPVDADLEREAGMDGNYGNLLQAARGLDLLRWVRSPACLDVLRAAYAAAVAAGPTATVDADLDREAGMDGNYGHLLQAARRLDMERDLQEAKEAQHRERDLQEAKEAQHSNSDRSVCRLDTADGSRCWLLPGHQSPCAARPVVDVSARPAEIIAACVALGATVTVTRSNSCYTSKNSYSTPSYRTWFDGAWRSEGPVDDVTVTRCKWPLGRSEARGSSVLTGHLVATGPTMADVLRVTKGGEPTATARALRAVLVYDRPATLRANGDRGEGVVVAMGVGVTSVSDDDQRGFGHLYTDAAGDLHLGRFA